MSKAVGSRHAVVDTVELANAYSAAFLDASRSPEAGCSASFTRLGFLIFFFEIVELEFGSFYSVTRSIATNAVNGRFCCKYPLNRNLKALWISRRLTGNHIIYRLCQRCTVISRPLRSIGRICGLKIRLRALQIGG